MDLGLTGRVALVAGGSRGCGRAISEALAAEGARVVLTGRQAQYVESAAVDITRSGGTVQGVVADMTNADGVAAMVDAARTAFGDPEILVVNSPAWGGPDVERVRGFERCDDDSYLGMYDNFVLSQVRLARAVLPAMKRRGWGRLLNIGSIGFKVPHQEDPLPATDTGRMGVVPLMRILSYEYGRFGITANTIATGPFRTEHSGTYQSSNPEIKTEQWYLDTIAVGRWGEPAEMGSLAAFICSERAAFLTGEVIRLDGGYTRSLF